MKKDWSLKVAKKHVFMVCILLVAFMTGILVGYFKHDFFYTVKERLLSYKANEKAISALSDFYNSNSQPGYEPIYFINGEKKDDCSGVNSTDDIKEVLLLNDGERLINFADGYSIDFDEESVYDFTCSPFFVTVTGGEYECTLSREYSPYDDIDGYFDYYLNRFVLNENFREQNRITLLDNRDIILSGVSANIISVRLDDCPEKISNVYTYVLYKIGGRTYYRVMFKYRDYDQNWPWIEESLASMKFGGILGQTRWTQENYQPQPALFWDDATQELYMEIQKPDEKIKWGIYTSQMNTDGIEKKVPELEKSLDYSFDLLMTYFDIDNPPPIEFMKKASDQGKMIELTMHVTANANTDVYGYTPMLDIYRGEMDETIRKAARELKKIKTPFLLRLNNEMNSDWTSYSGIVNLGDPQIYKDVWVRIYNIFAQEGVSNAIWIFNPNDRNYPPCNFNHFIAYFPGEEYVQMIGVTGYNTGTYYQDVFGEQWREFEDIYSNIEEEFQKYFKKYPWIITEFASSSYGGNKASWIGDMFAKIGEYENIKAAVWYSCPDMDFRPEYAGKIARPYMLDETEDTLKAFKEGLHQYLAK